MIETPKNAAKIAKQLIKISFKTPKLFINLNPFVKKHIEFQKKSYNKGQNGQKIP